MRTPAWQFSARFTYLHGEAPNNEVYTVYRMLCTLMLVCVTGTASAVVFNVNNTTVDLPDGNPGDGICHVAGGASGSDCTLRAAIMEANMLLDTPATIVVPSRSHIVLTLTGSNEDADATGDLDIRTPSPLTITTLHNLPGSVPIPVLGARAMIDANGIDRVFDIQPIADAVTLQNLIITGGRADAAGTYLGGGIKAEGAVALLVEQCEMFDNSANAGGAIWVYTVGKLNGALKVYQSYLHDNTVATDGFTNAWGSAIRDIDGGSDLGSIVIDSSTLSNNHCSGDVCGGSAAVELISPLVVWNSTFDGNQPTAVSAYNTTVHLNQVTITGSQLGYRYGSYVSGVTSFIRNSIIADNVWDCEFDSGSYSVDHAYTLASDDSCLLGAPGTGNLPHSDPQLKPLAPRFWDSSNPVRDLATGSPAIDTGYPLVGPSGACLAQDEDGIARPIDGDGVAGARCDMGAVEYTEHIFGNGFDGIPANP